MKILSLFDGMSCGYLAMLKAGVGIDRYVAYEIDKYAIQTAKHNFPNIEECGDVFSADFTQYKGFDFIVGGSPCTYWSIAKTSGRETTASGMGWDLFQQYVRAVRDVQPKYFIYENNKSMSKDIRASITKEFGFDAIHIDSALVSAQHRDRLYWVGVRQEDGSYLKANVPQPDDRGILLRDILDGNYGVPNEDESYVLTASYNGAVAWNTLERNQRSMVAESINEAVNGKSFTLKSCYYKQGVANFVTNNGFNASCVAERIPSYGNDEKSRPISSSYGYKSDGESGVKTDAFPDDSSKQRFDFVASQVDSESVCVAERGRYDESGNINQHLEAREDGKTNALTTVQKDNNVAQPVRVGEYPNAKGELKKSQGQRIYSVRGKSVALSANGGGQGAKTGLYSMPVAEATKKGYTEIDVGECVDLCQPNSNTRRGRKMADKSNCLTTSSEFYQYCGGKDKPIYEVKGGKITIKGKQYPIKLKDGKYIIRKLSVEECKRLQTVPEWYDFSCVSNCQAYKMLGNGWTIDVIAHLIEHINDEATQMTLF